MTERIKTLKSILDFFIPSLENLFLFPIIIPRIKVSLLHFYSPIKGISQGHGFLQRGEWNAVEEPSPGDGEGSGIPLPWLPRGLAVLSVILNPQLPPPLHLTTECLDPSTQKSAAPEIVLIQ